MVVTYAFHYLLFYNIASANKYNSARLQNPAPLDYTPPSFPSLYYPYLAKPGEAKYLYYAYDIWRFTLLWTVIQFAFFHLVVAGWAVAMQLGKTKHAWKYVWIIPLFYALISGIEAVMAGSITGLMSVHTSCTLYFTVVGSIANFCKVSGQFTTPDTSDFRHGYLSYGHLSTS